jgi:adenylate cyclase
MSVALGLGLGFFVLTAVASVLAVGLVSGYHNTVDLLRQKAELLVVSEVNQTRFYLESARDQVDFVVDQIERGELEAGADDAFLSLLMGALAATPQIVLLQHIDADYQLVGAERREMQVSPLFLSIKGDDTDLKRLFDEVVAAREPRWGPLLWRQEYGEATLNYHRPVVRDGRVLGVVSALISIRRLSELISDLETDFGANAFILHGRDEVLAHPMMAFGHPGLNRTNPLPRQSGFGDPVLASMWSEQPSGFFFDETVMAGPGTRFVRFGEESYIILFRDLDGYAAKPLIVGTHLPALDILSEIYRLRWAIILCLVISVISSAVAASIGRAIARPVRRLAESAKRIHDLELGSVAPIPGSFFRELNDAASSFNTMLDGLRWFERYVPKTLVRRLIRLDQDDALGSSYRDVAIMFTDIENFSTITETMTAPAVAEFVNRHFTTLSECVEAEGGTIDKYIGDSVMAIWGAPEPHDDCADRACRAALAIQAAVGRQNAGAAAEGGPRLRLRIGIHSGRVVAGNIGSPDRINYTVVGDPVNVTERLEELGKEIGRTDDDINILVSGTLRAALLQPFDLTHLGPQKLRGRQEQVEVYVLNGA